MTEYDLIVILLTVIGVLLIPTIGVLFRGMVRWVRTEDQLTNLVHEVKELVNDNEKSRGDILRQMTYDREATNTRLRYLEEYFMSHGMGKDK